MDELEEVPFTEEMALRLLRESASGILYLHSVGIVHRDIKPENILIDYETKIAKIADFGIARVADTSGEMTHRGTHIYQAPEVTKGERYGFAVDTYSFAITMLEVCSRNLPFTSHQRSKGIKLALDVANKNHRPTIPENWNPGKFRQSER